MRLNHLISIIVVINCVLFLQMGCQEQAKVPTEPEVTLTVPVQITGPQKAEPEKAEPEKAKLEKTEPEKAEAKPEAVKIGPKITFEKVVYDFGEIGPMTKNTGEFKFTNTGDDLLKITDVERCCGVVAQLSKKEYQPGESGTLKVEYRSSLKAGIMRRQLYVNSNDQTKPKITLTIKAETVPKVSYEPERLQLLLKDENAGCPKITITGLDGKPFSIKGFTSTGNCITADYDPSVEATKFVLQPTVDMERLQRNLNGLINISLTHPESSSITIYFSALPKFKINPPQLIAFNAEPGKPITRKIWVLNNYGEDFEVESVSSQNGIIKVLSQDKIDHGYQLMLEIVPPAAEGQTRFMDTFYVNVKGGQKLAAKCQGFYLRKK
ncbi:MAG: DUF1573 domain-containing protein [Gammaproteobacteria bacterium]|nr:DUF1573 domain-containing protein [Gammaproteobacteria bacterium]